MTRPNRDGASGAIGITDLIIKAFQWWNWMDQFDRGYSHIARFARHHLLRHVRDTAQRKKVWDLIVLIEDSIPIFRARGFDRVGPCVGLRETEQRLAANRCTAACAALTVYWGDPEIIQAHCGLLVGRGDQWAAFSQALTENSLKGWKDWRQSLTPLFWLKDVTDTIAEKESRDYTTVDVDVLPLEEIAEMPADAVLAHIPHSFGAVSVL